MFWQGLGRDFTKYDLSNIIAVSAAEHDNWRPRMSALLGVYNTITASSNRLFSSWSRILDMMFLCVWDHSPCNSSSLHRKSRQTQSSWIHPDFHMCLPFSTFFFADSNSVQWRRQKWLWDLLETEVLLRGRCWWLEICLSMLAGLWRNILYLDPFCALAVCRMSKRLLFCSFAWHTELLPDLGQQYDHHLPREKCCSIGSGNMHATPQMITTATQISSTGKTLRNVQRFVSFKDWT